MEQVKVDLPADEWAALFHLSEKELRTPARQLRHILQEELKERGLLHDEQSAEPGPCDEPE